MPAPTRPCPSTCAPGGPGQPTGSVATSPHAKTVRANPKEPAAHSPKGIGGGGKEQAWGPNLSLGPTIRFPRDSELGPELGLFRRVPESKPRCVQGCLHSCLGHKSWPSLPPGAPSQARGSGLCAKPGATGPVLDEIGLRLTCSSLAGTQRGQADRASPRGQATRQKVLSVQGERTKGCLPIWPAPVKTLLSAEQEAATPPPPSHPKGAHCKGPPPLEIGYSFTPPFLKFGFSSAQHWHLYPVGYSFFLWTRNKLEVGQGEGMKTK